MKVAILGYGKEGKAAERYFKAKGAEIEIFDPVTPESLDKIDVSCYDIVLRSPSIPPRAGISSVTRYFFEHCPAPIIGVTGTKGKGTTCTMIAELLKALGHKVWLLGNIGVPAIDDLDKISKDDVVVYEMSSFQLWDATRSPHIAVVLRIEPDHLNVHRDFADYVAAKGHIAEWQGAEDSVIYFQNNAESAKIAERSAGRKIPYPVRRDGEQGSAEKIQRSNADTGVDTAKLDQLLDSLTVPGQHNRENAEAALLAVAAFLGVSLAELMDRHYSELSRGLKNFKGLPHHIEWVRRLNGVDYYDDSFSTAEQALEVALASFAERSVVLIAGGQDKGIDYGPTKKLIFETPNLAKAILIGEIAPKLSEGEPAEKYLIVKSLEEAVKEAQKVAEAAVKSAAEAQVPAAKTPAETPADKRTGVVVLMSPGAASLDMFESYYQRGELFQKFVRELR